MGTPFHFKEFSIDQDRCAMKVGTDAVVLGAWASLGHQPQSIVDVGAGTGILALMMAQRSNAELIDALEIDPNAYEQCVNNFEASPWGDRLFCYHAGFDEFVEEIGEQYDLIISNPPFFGEGLKPKHAGRNRARFAEALPLKSLISQSSKLLTAHGSLALILPYDQKEKALALAAEENIYPQHITDVKGRAGTGFKRSLMQFSKIQKELNRDQLTIEYKRHQYTEEFRRLTSDFYVKM